MRCARFRQFTEQRKGGGSPTPSVRPESSSTRTVELSGVWACMKETKPGYQKDPDMLAAHPKQSCLYIAYSEISPPRDTPMIEVSADPGSVR